VILDTTRGSELKSTIYINKHIIIDALGHRIESKADPAFLLEEANCGIRNMVLFSVPSNHPDYPLANDLVVCNKAGGRFVPLIENCYFGYTKGHALHLAGVQQTTIKTLQIAGRETTLMVSMAYTLRTLLMALWHQTISL